MTRPPPTSPPFPSTTLFRSRLDAGHRPIDAARPAKTLAAARGEPLRPGGLLHEPDDRLRERERLDRKSTHLNSSHLVISYAVFCLKKKKKKHINKITAPAVY